MNGRVIAIGRLRFTTPWRARALRELALLVFGVALAAGFLWHAAHPRPGGTAALAPTHASRASTPLLLAAAGRDCACCPAPSR